MLPNVAFEATFCTFSGVIGSPCFFTAFNVVMKLSAVPSRSSYPHRDPAAVVKQLTDAFGADRLMYGGGYGAKATGDSYRAERERIAGLLGHLSAGDRDKVFGGTAAKLFGFGAD